MRLLLLIAVPLLLYFVLQAKAQDQQPVPGDGVPGRFAMQQVDDGLLRMDTQTGEVSICRRKLENWVCEDVADGESAKDEEIARLTEENARLRDRLAELEKGRETPDADGTIELPTKEDLDKAMTFFEDVMRRFNEMVKRLDKQVNPEPDKQKI